MARVTVADGTTIAYDVIGPAEADPIVFVMGLGVDRWGWIRQRGPFSDRHRCVFPDNRGSGLSDKPRGPYDLRIMADDVAAVLDDCGIERAHVVGASMGGAIAQYLALVHADRVHSLTLACTTCRVSPWRRRLLRDWIDLLDGSGRVRFARENLRWVLGARHLRRMLPLTPVVAPLVVRAPTHGIRGQIEAILAVDPLIVDNLEAIAVPTLVVAGSQDILTPVADAEELAGRIPDAELRVLMGAAHGLMLTSAGIFNRHVAEFHQRVTASSDAADSGDQVVGGGL